MFPELFSLGPITVHTYGVMAALGFLLALRVIRKLSVRHGVSPEKMMDLTFYCLIFGIIGARILFVITRWEYFQSDLLGVFRIWEGGLVFFGGFVLALAFALWYVRKQKINTWEAADIMAPGLTIAHALGRVGCLATGCCYGKPTDMPWGIKINSDVVEAHLRGIPLHPTQLYEAVSLAILFAGLMWMHRKRAFAGQITAAYLLIYPIVRSVIEIYRGDTIRGFVISDVVSTSQFISIFVFGAGVYVWIRRSKTSRHSRSVAR